MSVSQVDLPPGYPREWEADVVLTDGGVARLRPIRPSDAQKLVAFYERVSPESKYLRFFAPYPRLSSRDVKRFTEVDYVDRVAFILTVGDEMIGVGRFDRTEDDRAEVAFLVEDAHQGRGIAQLLLEHLAEAARERGITGFVAEVLPENRRMAQVFADAGYRVSKGIEDGVLSVEFPILPTDTSVGVMERREHRAESASVHRLLHPERVVVHGPGRRVAGLVNAMLCGGFRGEVVAVSSDGVPVPGVPTATSVAMVPGRLDLAVLAVPTTELGGVVIDAAHKGAHGIVVLTGTDDRPGDNRTVVNLARAYGIRALGPDALGLINTWPLVELNATPGPMPRTGGVGLFCQSAAVGVALLNHAVRQDLGLSSFISTGDYADVTGNDVMQYWEDDDNTRVCLLALDSIGNPRKFSRITRRLTRRKPVVVLEPGRTSRSWHAGVRGGLGHAPDEAVDALFRQAGVMVVHRRGAMFDIAKIAARQPLPRGQRVRLVTNSATLAAQMEHTIGAVGLLHEESVLLRSSASPQDYVDATLAALADPRTNSVVCAAVNVYEEGTEDVITALDQIAGEGDKPLVGVFLDFHPPMVKENDVDLPGELPRFDAPVDAIHALSTLTAYAHWRERDPGAVPLLEVDTSRAKRVVNRALSGHPEGRLLNGAETTELLQAYGITMVPRFVVSSLEEAVAVAEQLGWNVVLKGTAASVRSRPDQAGVQRNLMSAEEMVHAWAQLEDLTRALGLGGDVGSVATPVVQAMAPPGVALVVTSREDAAFGPIISLGLEGIPTELLGDTVYRVPPLTTVDAAAMVRDLRAAPTLFGRHGSPGVHIAGIEDLLHRVAQLADDLPQLASVELSPCIASRDGMAVLGARIFTAPTDDRRDPLARTL
ncbi:Acyl-CoA synthetase (NDP forming) [Friedmanniella luteola]|uniref:Acyl-CoA synthetase (NDP forming) n=1 Tax=Friedmanniella luteola TaxID=546871 RepID=A0A1H1RYX8_9ACTN|nr:GNAT family N-acetyltransferase [Friedmanniella luteola]SDS40818.1 Acyl-CoA synthetase (NDP forming) [Friedmanniella luteola]